MGWRSLPMLLALVAVSLGGCATTAFVAPAAFDDSALRGRAETAAGEEIRVRAALLHREEAEAIFGVDLASRGIEPVWLEIENGSDGLLRFLPTGMDPEYFSPREAAFGYHKAFSPETRALVDDHFESLNFTDPVPPGETVSGFVLTNLEEGAKVVNVDLVGRKYTWEISPAASCRGAVETSKWRCSPDWAVTIISDWRERPS